MGAFRSTEAARVAESVALAQVTIVDDGFDLFERFVLTTEEADELWAEIRNSGAAKAELEGIELTLNSIDALNPDFVSQFLGAKEKCCTFLPIWDGSIAGGRWARSVGALLEMTENLRGKLKLKVCTLGANALADNAGLLESQLIMLDWHLGDDGDGGHRAIAASEAKAKEIYAKWPAERPKPLIVLMSSYPEVLARGQDFRKASGLLAGSFFAVLKEDLFDAFLLQMHFSSYKMSVSAAGHLQRFVDALRNKLQTVSEEFAAKISDLSLQDYAYIQRLSLQDDGHPLGDYLLWLYGAFFGHLMFGKALRAEREELDQLSFDDVLPPDGVPSDRLAEIYHCALFDMDVGDVEDHPLASRKGDAPSAMPLLSLGDVFIQDAVTTPDVAVGASQSEAKSELGLFARVKRMLGYEAAPVPTSHPVQGKFASADLYMIINAQCDLAFAPAGSRTMDPARAILLLPGRLTDLDGFVPPDAITTELFRQNRKNYRIVWDTKKVMSVPYGNFNEWLTQNQPYHRIARLRLPFALEVQQAFAADLTRVGMPVAPPLYQPAIVDVLRSKAGVYEAMEGATNVKSFITLTKSGRKLFLTLPVVRVVRDALVAHVKDLANDAANKHAAKQIEALRGVLEDSESEWIQLRMGLEPPTLTTDRPLFGGLVQLVMAKKAGDLVAAKKTVVSISLLPAPDDVGA